MFIGFTGGTGRRVIRAIKRATRGKTRKRRRAPKPGRPVGPKLVRGRGYARRRTGVSVALFVVSVVVGMLVLLALRAVVLPRMIG